MNRLTLAPNSTNVDPTTLDPTELNLFVVTAHPDDEALVAGIIAKNKQRQDKKLASAVLAATKGGSSTVYRLPHDTLPRDPKEFSAHLKNVRTKEFYQGVGQLGVNWAFLLDLDDGEIRDMLNTNKLSEELAKQAFGLSGFYSENPWAFLTLGPEGFDGHTDHSTTHDVAMNVSEMLLQRGIHMPVFGLNARGNGQHQILLTDELRRAKRDVISSHPSQMPLTVHGELDSIFFEGLGEHKEKYEEVFNVKETYDLYPPRVPYLLE